MHTILVQRHTECPVNDAREAWAYHATQSARVGAYAQSAYGCRFRTGSGSGRTLRRLRDMERRKEGKRTAKNRGIGRGRRLETHRHTGQNMMTLEVFGAIAGALVGVTVVMSRGMVLNRVLVVDSSSVCGSMVIVCARADHGRNRCGESLQRHCEQQDDQREFSEPVGHGAKCKGNSRARKAFILRSPNGHSRSDRQSSVLTCFHACRASALVHARVHQHEAMII